MVEFSGDPVAVALQKRLRDRQSWIAQTPAVANGGRVLNVLDPEVLGWDKVRKTSA